MAIKVGDRVKIEGLQRRPDLNGTEGWVLRQVNARWGIALDAGSEAIAVRPCNLVVIESPAFISVETQTMQRKAIIRRLPSNLWVRTWSFLEMAQDSVVVTTLWDTSFYAGDGEGPMTIMTAEYSIASGSCIIDTGSSIQRMNPRMLGWEFMPQQMEKELAPSRDASLLFIEGQEFCTHQLETYLNCEHTSHGTCFEIGFTPATTSLSKHDGSARFLAASGAGNPYHRMPVSVAARSVTAGWIACACAVRAPLSSYQLRLITSQGATTLYRLPAEPKLIKVSEDKILVWCVNGEAGITQVTDEHVARRSFSTLSEVPMMMMTWIGSPKCSKYVPVCQATSLSDKKCAFLLESGDVQIRQYNAPDRLSDIPSCMIEGLKAERMALSKNMLVTLEEFGSLKNACVVRRLHGTGATVLQVIRATRSGKFSGEYIYHVMFKPHSLDIDRARKRNAPKAADVMQKAHRPEEGLGIPQGGADNMRYDDDSDHYNQVFDVVEFDQHDERFGAEDNSGLEVPAAIPPAEAEGIVRAQWEAHVESKIEQSINPASAQSRQTIECLVLAFSRHPRSFDTALFNSQLGKLMKEDNAEIQPSWAKGAKVLVPGLTAETWAQATPSLELGPYHAVVLAGDEAEVMSTLQSLGRQRPRLKASKPVQTVEVPLDISDFCEATDSNVSMNAITSEHGSLSVLSSEAQTGGSSTGYELLARTEWLSAVKNAVTSVQVVHLPVAGLMIHEAPSPMVTPRSEVIASDPGRVSATGLSSINPRHFCNP